MTNKPLRQLSAALALWAILSVMPFEAGQAQMWQPTPTAPAADNGKRMWDDLRPAPEGKRLPIPVKRVPAVIPQGIEPLFDLAHGPEYGPEPAWYDEFHVVANAIQHAPDAVKDKRQRVVLIDVRDGTWRELAPSGRFLCLTDDHTHISIAPNIFRRDIHGQLMRITPKGELQPASADMANIDPRICKIPAPPNFIYGATYPLQEVHGFIRIEPPRANDTEAMDQVLLYPPNGRPNALSTRGSETHTATYLPHLNRYLLNEWDSQGSGFTDHALNPVNWGNRGYHLTPYRLMAPDGSTIEMPYPDIIFKHGVKGFSKLMVTKTGIAMTTYTANDIPGGILFTEGKELFRLEPQSGDGLRGQLWSSSTSPDGCTIVIRNFRKIFKFFDRHQFMFMNTCTEAK